MNKIFHCIDLASFYNSSLDEDIHHKSGNDLKNLPHGKSEINGIEFNVNGLIQLGGLISKEKTGIDYPFGITGIKINQLGSAIHFMQSSSWHAQSGTKIREYRIHFSNGACAIVPIIYEENVVDWWYMPGDKLPTKADVAWTGENERTKSLEFKVQLYSFSWNNPFPEILIDFIDFISLNEESAPFLLGLTIQK